MSDENIARELHALKRELAEIKAALVRKKALTRKTARLGVALLLLLAVFAVNADTIGKPYTFTAGTVISAAEVNANFDALYAESNAQHTRIATLEANSLEKTTIRYLICAQGIYPTRPSIVASIGGDGAIGEIAMFAGNFEPVGWFFCDGRLLQIQQNTALYSILGNTYGGDGRTTFALPDLRGKLPIHPK